jgi:hypothetical protein
MTRRRKRYGSLGEAARLTTGQRAGRMGKPARALGLRTYVVRCGNRVVGIAYISMDNNACFDSLVVGPSGGCRRFGSRVAARNWLREQAKAVDCDSPVRRVKTGPATGSRQVKSGPATGE